MGRSILSTLILGVLVAPQMVVALGSGDAQAMFDGFNRAFLVTSGSDVYYKIAINNAQRDPSWTGALDILVAEDAYDATGDAGKRDLVQNLCTTWLARAPPPWTWNTWNDDIGWYTLALIRGYQITGTANFLTQAKYGFDMAFARGWETAHNGGGIWEEQPSSTVVGSKNPLSNDSLGKVACMIYQSTHDANYYNKCKEIYQWVRTHIFDQNTGQIYAAINQDGSVNRGAAAYNQGTFVDFANLYYEITGDGNGYNDAVKAINYAKNSLTSNGVFTKTDDYINTWADEVARGAGHFIRDHRLWDTYYDWFVQNANAILANRRTDYGITWNGWTSITPRNDGLIVNKYCSAAAWLWYTPVTKPNGIGGIHSIVNQKTGMAIDSAGTWGNGKGVVQWGPNSGANQRWLLTQNSDTSWNIISQSTWQALDVPAYDATDGVKIDQWQPKRTTNQRWWIDRQSDGSYKIWNKATSKALDGSSSTANGFPLVQWGWNGQSQQRWIIQ